MKCKKSTLALIIRFLLGFALIPMQASAQLNFCISTQPSTDCKSPLKLDSKPSYGDFGRAYGINYYNNNRGKEANTILKNLYKDIDKTYFKWCSPQNKCRFMDDNNLDNHRNIIADKKRENIDALRKKYKDDLELLGQDKANIEQGKEPQNPKAQTEFNRLKTGVKQKAETDLKDTKTKNTQLEAENKNKKSENVILSTQTIPALAAENQALIEETERIISDEVIIQQDEESQALRDEIKNITSQPQPAAATLEGAQGVIVPGQSGLPVVAPNVDPKNASALLEARGQAFFAEGLLAQGQRNVDRAIAYQNYQTGATLPYQGVKLSEMAQNEFASSATPHTFLGYQNVLLFNAFADSPRIMNNEGGLGSFARALALRLESQLVIGPVAELGTVFSLLDQGWGLVDYAKGVGIGLVTSAYNTWSGLHAVINDPMLPVAAIYYAYKNWDSVSAAFTSELLKSFETLKNCSQQPSECGEIKGRLAGDIATLYLGSLLSRGEKMLEEAGSAAMKVSDDLVKLSETAGRHGIDTAGEMKSFMKFLGADCLATLSHNSRQQSQPFLEKLLGIETAYAAGPCDVVQITNRMAELLDKLPPGTNVEWIVNAQSTVNKLKSNKDRVPQTSYNALIKRMADTAGESESAAKGWMNGQVSNPNVVAGRFNGGAIAEAEALTRVMAKPDVEVVELGRVLKKTNGLDDATDVDLITKESGKLWLTEVKSNTGKWKPESMEAYVDHAKTLGNAGIRFYYENHAPSYLGNIRDFFKARGYSVENANLELIPFKQQ